MWIHLCYISFWVLLTIEILWILISNNFAYGIAANSDREDDAVLVIFDYIDFCGITTGPSNSYCSLNGRETGY